MARHVAMCRNNFKIIIPLFNISRHVSGIERKMLRRYRKRPYKILLQDPWIDKITIDDMNTSLRTSTHVRLSPHKNEARVPSPPKSTISIPVKGHFVSMGQWRLYTVSLRS